MRRFPYNSFSPTIRAGAFGSHTLAKIASWPMNSGCESLFSAEGVGCLVGAIPRFLKISLEDFRI